MLSLRMLGPKSEKLTISEWEQDATSGSLFVSFDTVSASEAIRAPLVRYLWPSLRSDFRPFLQQPFLERFFNLSSLERPKSFMFEHGSGAIRNPLEVFLCKCCVPQAKAP